MRSTCNHFLFLFLLTCMVHLNAFSQPSGNLWLSTGFQAFTSRDAGFSSMKYSGPRSFSTGAFALQRPHKTETFQVEFGIGPLSNQIGNSLNALSAGFWNSTFYHREKDADRGLHWGWSNQNLLNLRRHNGFTNYSLRYDYFTSIGPALRYRYPFQWKGQQFSWQTLAHWQVVGFQIKSGFIGADPAGVTEDGEPLDNFLRAVDPFYVGRDWHLGLESTLVWTLPAGNDLALRYRPEFAFLKGGQPIHRVGHAVSLLINFRIW